MYCSNFFHFDLAKVIIELIKLNLLDQISKTNLFV